MPARRKKKDALDAALAASTVQLLFKAARLLDERGQERVNAAAQKRVLRPSHARLLPFLGRDGIRLTTLAERLDVTKQAVGQAVAELEAAGIVDLVADPADGRAKLVRLNERGVQAMQHGLGVLRGLEEELGDAVGKKTMRALHDALEKVLAAIDAGALS